MIICYAVPSEITSPKWCNAFVAGTPDSGLINNGELRPAGDVALFGSPKLWPLLTQTRNEGRNWYYGDHGYFGRGRFYRCTKNAYMHSGSFIDGNINPKKFDKFGIKIKPWRKKGRFIMFCPPGQVHAGLKGFNTDDWQKEVIDKLRQHTDREIIIRMKTAAKEVPLKEALHNCWALVTYNSNAAVEAALEGVPVFPLADCSASMVGTSDLSKIETPYYPNFRYEWASVLANNQWTLPQMECGQMWEELNAK